MKRVGLVIREEVIGEIKENIKGAEGYFFISFNKVKAFSVSQLRNNLRTSGAKVYVAKNSLLERAFEKIDKDSLNALLEKETGVVFVHDKDVIKTCKALVDFTKENEAFQIKGGFLKDKKITVDELNTLAKLPPKEVLLGMAVSGIASPLTGFMSTLNQIILKFLWLIEEIKVNKEKNQMKPKLTEQSERKLDG